MDLSPQVHMKNQHKNFPVIIAGCGRSGTTFLKSLIDAHPEIFIPSESLYIIDYLRSENHWLKPVLKRVYWKEPQLKAWYKGHRFEFENFKEAIELTHIIQAQAEKKTIWGQKTPRFIRYKKILDQAFPSSKWILIKRDPRSVVASMLESKTHVYSIGLACKRWNIDNKYLLESQAEDNVFVISYEDLLKEPNHIIKNIFDFLNIQSYSIEFLVQRAKTREFNGSKFQKISIKNGFEPDVQKIDNWKSKLSSTQINAVEFYTKEIMTELGYIRSISAPKKPCFTNSYSLKEILILLEYIRKWPQYLYITFVRKFLLRLNIKK